MNNLETKNHWMVFDVYCDDFATLWTLSVGAWL